ncbi:hypothetical protein [Roseovarius atlanticus]|uniref:hypothetical protein n=1 Tax=Roseovarius atlanticus TaxID=1641875 RepID=UPI001C96CA8B|nr:hypothetical protein [Roseovarius atlanticus]MBY5986986.1 hypothetical protein [Roseovarius atlanticus]MBY6125626.1 hypothetical protein [Roseovarius atlanticus]MBY6149913.1 hypothetical protein [Roseovarius atlanticus]
MLGLAAGPVAADEVEDWIATTPERYRQALRAGQEDPTFSAFREMCPADVFRDLGREPGGSRDCTQRPGWCLGLCRAGQARACFGLGRAVEIELDVEGQATVKYPFFMAACAAGDANACTNAGAIAARGSWIAGSQPTVAAARACQVRTYETTCTARAPWGCYMLGAERAQAGDNGKAQDAWQRACDIDPDGSACDAARARLD